MNILKISLFLFVTFFQSSTINALWWPFGSPQPKKMQPFNGLTGRAADFAYLRDVAQTHNRKNVKAIAFTPEEQEQYERMWQEKELLEFDRVIFATISSLPEPEQKRTAQFLLRAERDAFIGYEYQFFLSPRTFALLITILGKPKNTEFAEQFIRNNTSSRIDRGDEIAYRISTEDFKTIFLATSKKFQRNYAKARLDNPGWHNDRFKDFFEIIIKQS